MVDILFSLPRAARGAASMSILESCMFAIAMCYSQTAYNSQTTRHRAGGVEPFASLAAM